MNTLVLETRHRWTVAGVGAVLVVAALVLLVRVPAPPAASVPPPRAAVELARPDAARRALVEETMMRDLTPLFLPTERNARLQQPPLREPGETVFDLPASSLTYAEGEPNLSRNLPAVVTLNGKPLAEARPIDALSGEVGAATLGFGRNKAAVTALAPRGGFIEVVALASGRLVLGEPLPLAARPPSDQPWHPLEFLGAVDASGLIAPLTRTTGSRVDEVDAHFRKYLAQAYRIGERLPPGFYRITVAP